MMFLMSTQIFGQWEKVFFTDEFGDETNQSFEKQTVIGTFSNTATTNSECRYDIFKKENETEIRIYTYNDNHRESWSKGALGSSTIYIKSPSGTKDTLCGNFFDGIR